MNNISFSPCPSTVIRSVPSNLKTTGGWCISSIGKIVSTSPASMTDILFCFGMTRFRRALSCKFNELIS